MGDLSQLVDRFSNRIAATARKFSQSRGSVLMSYEDLLQEGYLCLVEVTKTLEEHPEKISSSEDFERYFGKSLRRRMNMLVFRHFSTQKRSENVYRVDLSEVIAELPVGAFDEMYFRYGVTHLKSLLSPLAGKVLGLVLEPDWELVQLAINTQRRKQRLHELGVKVYGWNTVRILRRHLATYLAVSYSQLMAKIREIRAVYRREFSLSMT